MNIGGSEILTPSAASTITITIDPSVKHTVAKWTAAQIETVNISGTPSDGQVLTLMITNDSLLPRVINFGTGFQGGGAVTGLLGKRSVLTFTAVDGVFVEDGRIVGL